MTDQDSPFRRPISLTALITVIGVADALYGTAKHRYLHVLVGLFLVALGLTRAYQAWRAHRRRSDADAAGHQP